MARPHQPAQPAVPDAQARSRKPAAAAAAHTRDDAPHGGLAGAAGPSDPPARAPRAAAAAPRNSHWTDLERPTQDANRKVRLLRGDERERYSLCLAKKAVAFFRMSRSMRSSRTSRRSRRSSPRSSSVSGVSRRAGRLHPQPERLGQHAEIPRHVGQRIRRRPHQADRLGLELRAVSVSSGSSHRELLRAFCAESGVHETDSIPQPPTPQQLGFGIWDLGVTSTVFRSPTRFRRSDVAGIADRARHPVRGRARCRTPARIRASASTRARNRGRSA